MPFQKILLLGSLILGFSVISQAEVAPPLIKVSSYAEVSLEPNMVILTVEVWAKTAAAKTSQELATKDFQRVKQVVEKYKIKKEDFVTTNYTVTPDYFYDQKTQRNRIVGFNVNQSLKITLRNVEKAGSFIDEITSPEKTDKSGANVQSISWDSDKKAAAEVQALNEAIKNAKNRAEDMAKAAGVKIKGLYTLINSQNEGGEISTRSNKMMLEMDSTASTQLPAGTVKVRSNVSAEYLIN